jgi:hypothetical protein
MIDERGIHPCKLACDQPKKKPSTVLSRGLWDVWKAEWLTGRASSPTHGPQTRRSAPGMGSQPVWVAQRAQIAIARR